MNNRDHKIDRKLVWCLAGLAFIRKKRKVKNKNKFRMFMHVLVKKMLIIKFNGMIIDKVMRDRSYASLGTKIISHYF